MTEKQDNISFWKKVLSEVQLDVSPGVFGTFISRTSVEQFEGSIIKVACDDELIKRTIDKKYLNLLEEAAKKIGNNKNLVVKLTVSKTKNQNVSTGFSTNLGPLFQNSKDSEELLKEKILSSGLSPKFTFENYIMGKSNQLAYAIATAIAERPGEIYNPVFIYSGVGLGKTHLIQAIGNKVLKTKPGTKVIYTTGESFTNELIESLQSGKDKGRYTSNNFRNKFRKADVLLIDDIQFIAGKEATQEEFFHTFNALYMSQKQIVITSDKPPKDFKNIEERLTSRFNSGIIADIQAPDIETRVAILRSLRDKNKDPVTNNVIDIIADTVTTNIRELEGAYMQVLTNSVATATDITPEAVYSSLGKTVKEKLTKSVNMNHVLNAVCAYYSIKSFEIKGPKRTKGLVVPRQVAMYLIKELTGTPYMSIGDFLGGRDHTTIMHGVDKVEKEIKRIGKLRQDVTNVKQIIYSE